MINLFLVQEMDKDWMFKGEGGRVGGLKPLPSCYFQHILTVWASPNPFKILRTQLHLKYPTVNLGGVNYNHRKTL